MTPHTRRLRRPAKELRQKLKNVEEVGGTEKGPGQTCAPRIPQRRGGHGSDRARQRRLFKGVSSFPVQLFNHALLCTVV